MYVYFKLQKSWLNDNAKLIKYFNSFIIIIIAFKKITNTFNRLICKDG
jgi:hypothetical protein